jgi:hypothetical protein
MSAIFEEDQLKDSVDNLKDNDSASQFYGGMKYKQNKNDSLYHYGNTSSADVVRKGRESDHWEQVRLMRDKCINLFKKYTNKEQ